MGIVQRGVNALGRHGAAIFILRAPHALGIVLPEHHRGIGQQADRRADPHQKAGRTQAARPPAVGHQKAADAADHHQQNRGAPPAGRKLPQHIAGKGAALAGIAHITEPHHAVKDGIVAALHRAENGKQVKTQPIYHLADPARQDQGNRRQQQRPAQAEGDAVGGVRGKVAAAIHFHGKVG